MAIDQHNSEIHFNQQAWDKKVLLQRSYSFLYQTLEKEISDKTEGLTLEIGSGIGKIKNSIPYCTTSDIFENSWLDRIENAYQINYPDQSLSNLILFDVWHHLEFPNAFLQEAFRVLKKNGKLILMEPDMSATGRFIYGNFHHEPLGFEHKFDLSKTATQNTYFAAQASAYRFFIQKEYPSIFQNWQLKKVERIASMAYLASGGFSGKSFYPAFCYPYLAALDRLLSKLPSLFSARVLLVLEPNK